VRECQIYEDALEYDEDTDREKRNTDATDDPVDMAVSCPSEEKQANRDSPAADQCRDQALFWSSESMRTNIRTHDIEEISIVCGDSDDAANCECEEGNARLSGIEPVALNIYQRKYLA